MSKKYQNKGEVVVEAPKDWLLRWDANTANLTYITDEATNDVASWIGEEGPEGLGSLTLLNTSVVSLYPEYVRDADGLLCIHCQDDGGLAVANLLAANAALHARLDDATNVTVFVVGMNNDPSGDEAGNAYAWHGVNGWLLGNVGLDASLDSYCNGAFRTAANTFDARRYIGSYRNLHNGVDDNDVETWVGKTSLYSVAATTDAAVSGSNNLTIGTYATGSLASWDSDCNIYEIRIYGRTLTDGEHAAVVDELSAKWQTTNADNATDVITEPLNTFPQDYWERWDATTSSGMGFFTDEATGDCNGWLGEKGNIWLVDSPGTNYPVWTPGKMTFAGSGDKALHTPVVTGVFSGNARAVFSVGQMNAQGDPYRYGSFTAGPTAYIRFEEGPYTDSHEMNFAYNDGTANNDAPTNSLIGSPIAVGYSTDMTDINWWWGGNSKHTATVSGGTFNEGLANLYVGMANADAATTMDGELYEVIVYDRHVTDAEAEQILAYLSAKWQAQNEDSASSVIATYDGLGLTWKSDGPDPQGLQLEGFTPVNHTVTPLRNADAPRVPGLPLDYVIRFDATDSSGIGYLTDPGTNDVDSWVDQTGTVTLLDSGVVTNYPEYITDADGLPCVHFQRDGTLVSTFFGSSSVDSTSFCVVKYNDMASESSNAYSLRSWGDFRVINTDAGGSKLSMFPVSVDDTTNDFDDTRCVLGFTNPHVGTDDNDWFKYLGLTQVSSGTAATDAATDDRRLEMGGYGGGSESDCNIYELIVYDRVLSNRERDDVAKYLSSKWEAQNEDSASSVVATVSTGSDVNFDDDRFPSSLPNLQFWARSDHTGGMTFDSGDAVSGGVVSSWVDITGNYTMNTTGSGDAAVDYRVNAVKGGFPSIEGGTAGSPKSLEATASINLNNDTGQQKLMWSVGTIGNAALSSSWGGPQSNTIFSGTYDAMATDMVAKPFVSYVTTPTEWVNYGIADAGLPADDGRIHISVWRVEDTGTDGVVESWYAGLKHPNRTSASADLDPRPAVGALGTSNFDAEGAQMLEIGVCGSLTTDIQTYTDQNVEDLIQYLCARYNVDYMPENTPITIGCWSRQTASNALTDTCLWHDPSTMTPTSWALHPNVAQYHTTPANFAISPPTGAVPMEKRTGTLGKPTFRSTEFMTQFMESDNAYTSTETTDFPADTLGMSTFGVMRLDPATVSSSGARTGNGICHVRFSGTSDTTLQVLASNVSKNWPHANDWIIIGNSYAYDDDGTGTEGYPGSVDGGPGAYYYCNDETVLTAATPAATSYTVENWVNWDIADGVAHISELVTFKHPLTIEEINELKKYFQYKYNYLFDT